MSAKSSEPVAASSWIFTSALSVTSAAMPATISDRPPSFSSTVKMSRMSTSISTPKAAASPAEISFIRLRIRSAASSVKKRMVPESTASDGTTL